jgi:FKBP-type peptidyl-prolyl cis-trans isomerase (trigger factor)
VSSAEIERQVTTIGDVEIDRTLEILRKQRVQFRLRGESGQDGDDVTAKDGDRVTVDFVGKTEGEAFDGGSAVDFAFVLGEKLMLPDFEKAVLGLKAGVMDALLKLAELDVPTALVQQDQLRLVEIARQDLAQRGVPNADKAPIPAELFKPQAERRVKLGLLLAELVKDNKLEAKPEQIRAEVDEFAKSYEDPKEVIRWYYSDQQRLAEMEAYVVESNVVDFVLGKAKVTDKEVSFEELASATQQQA